MKLPLKSALLKCMVGFFDLPLFFTFSCQFGFHRNLKPYHPSFISDSSPKAQVPFCHFCHLFASLCNAEYVPNKAHQVQLPAYAHTIGKPLLSSHHLKQVF